MMNDNELNDSLNNAQNNERDTVPAPTGDVRPAEAAPTAEVPQTPAADAGQSGAAPSPTPTDTVPTQAQNNAAQPAADVPQPNGSAQQTNGYAQQANGYAQQQNGYAQQQNGYAQQQNGYAQQQNGYAQQQSGSYAQTSHTYTSYNRAPTRSAVPAKKSSSGGISRSAAVILCVCAILLSCASGFFGAYLATKNLTPESTAPSGSVGTQDASGDGTKTDVVFHPSVSPAEGMSSSGGTSDYYNVASAVKDSVVEITTEYVVSSYFQYIASGAGSGVILSEDGYIVTNNHVIANTESSSPAFADTITVRLTNGEEYPARIIGADADFDIAVIKIDVTGLTYAVIGDSDTLAVGEEVIAVGNPLGRLGGTVTNGIISAKDREVNVDGTQMNLMQTNAAINPGNSGGGLFNMSGELIGIVNAKSSGTGIEGLGFAIPINEAIDVAKQLIAQGYVSGKPDLGVTFYDVTSLNQMLYLGVRSLGVYVYSLDNNLNADVFKVGDRIITMDGKEISSSSEIKSLLKQHAIGDRITFTVYRGGRMVEVTATCYEYTPDINFN